MNIHYLYHYTDKIELIFIEWYLQGYAAHLCSTISEWVMGLAFISYFFTYIKEFRQFDLELKVTQLEEYKHIRDFMGQSEMLADSQEVPTERSPLLT